MNILCIGNSFSMDSSRYLHQIARADGEKITVGNLYISGCSLEMHYRNLMGDRKNYEFEINGYSTGLFVSIKEALLSRRWDYVSMQQVSQHGVDYNTFQPFLSELSAYVKKYAPTAKQILQQTWGYRPESDNLAHLGYACHEDMYNDVKKAYEQAADEMNIDIVIPSGAVMNQLLKNGIESIHRDAIHANYGIGRYALGLTWYKALTGNSIDTNTFCDFDQEITPEEIEIVKKSVNEIV